MSELKSEHRAVLEKMVREIGPHLVEAYLKYGPILFMGTLTGLERIEATMPNIVAEIDDIPAKSYLIRGLKTSLSDVMANATKAEIEGEKRIPS